MRIIATVAICLALAGCGDLLYFDYSKEESSSRDSFYDSPNRAEIRKYLAEQTPEPSVYVNYITGKFADYNLVLPNGNRIRVCSGYGCKYKQVYRISPESLRKAKEQLGGAWTFSTGGEKERKGLANALSTIEQEMGSALRLDNDKQGARFSGNGNRGQMNATDEALNNTSILMVMARYKMFKHHDIIGPQWKSGALYPVIIDRKTGRKYGIDAGYRDHGGEIKIFDWEGSAP